MATGIAAAMLAEMTDHPDRCFTTFDWTIGAVTVKLSNHPVASVSAGQYKQRLSWGRFERPGPDRSYGLSGASGSVDIDDSDGEIGKQLGGPLRGEVTNSTAVAYVRSAEVVAGSHWKFFDGRVLDWSLSGPRRYGLRLGPNALALEAQSNAIRRINASDWPNAPSVNRDEPVYGRPGRAVYGKHRSAGLLDSTGLIQTIPVDDVENYWYVSAGRLPDSLVKVFRSIDGADFTESTITDWDLKYVLTNGVWNTVVDHLPGTASQTLDEVRVDLNGIETLGTGLGTVITNPADILQHILANWVFGAWPAGSPNGQAWLVPSALQINTTFFTEAGGFMADRGYAGSRVVTSDDTGIALLNSWCGDHKIGAFWAWDWKIAIRALDPPIDLESATLIRMEHQPQEIGEISGAPQSDALVNELTVEWLLDHAAGQTRRGPLRVSDTRLSPRVSDSMDLSWVQAAVVP